MSCVKEHVCSGLQVLAHVFGICIKEEKYYEKEIFKIYCVCSDHGNDIICYGLRWF